MARDLLKLKPFLEFSAKLQNRRTFIKDVVDRFLHTTALHNTHSELPLKLAHFLILSPVYSLFLHNNQRINENLGIDPLSHTSLCQETFCEVGLTIFTNHPRCIVYSCAILVRHDSNRWKDYIYTFKII